VNRFDERFRCMGCDCRVRLESAALGPDALALVGADVRAALEDAGRRMTRFDGGSELSRLNADPRDVVPVSWLMARLAGAAAWAGATSGGLVDATLTGELEAAGYAASRTGLEPASLRDALAAAPLRRPAGPRSRPGFAEIDVLAGDRVARPPGVRLDSGGLGKGLAADVAAALVPAGVRFAISAGGDLAAGGGDWEVAVAGALSGTEVHRLRVRGGVATSGIHERLWRRADGTYAHHLLDPATGEPAWTGLVAATAVAASALEAEVIAKTALLSGPVAARGMLRRGGGVLQHEDGRVEVLAPAPVVRLPRPPGLAALREPAAPRDGALRGPAAPRDGAMRGPAAARGGAPSRRAA
jgi:thiamine biosynthesis lipoprotein